MPLSNFPHAVVLPDCAQGGSLISIAKFVDGFDRGHEKVASLAEAAARTAPVLARPIGRDMTNPVSQLLYLKHASRELKTFVNNPQNGCFFEISHRVYESKQGAESMARSFESFCLMPIFPYLDRHAQSLVHHPLFVHKKRANQICVAARDDVSLLLAQHIQHLVAPSERDGIILTHEDVVDSVESDPRFGGLTGSAIRAAFNERKPKEWSAPAAGESNRPDLVH